MILKRNHSFLSHNAIIVLILAVTLLSFFFRLYYHEPASDDLLYAYKLDANPLGENSYEDRIETFGDALDSQYIQYFHSNGRAWIHVLVQMFAGPWGRLAYDCFMTIVMALAIVLFVKVSAGEKLRYAPIFWLAVSVMFMYLFQDNSGTWYSIAGGMNYLLPTVLSLGFILIVKFFSSEKARIRQIVVAAACVYSFLMGWCQECYSIPLSGASFVLALLNIKKINRNLLIVLLFLWIGTAILVFAPGNFSRLSVAPPLKSRIFHAITLFIGTKMLWLLIMTAVVAEVNKRGTLVRMAKDNPLLCLCFVFSCALGTVANTLPQSFNGVSLFSGILMFRLFSYISIDFESDGKMLNTISLLLLVVFGAHQLVIVQARRQIQKVHHDFVKQYVESPTGVVLKPDVKIHSLAKPFVKTWFSSPVFDWTAKTLSVEYGSEKKSMIMMERNDFSVFRGETKIDRLKSLPVGFYRGDNYCWVNASAFQSDSITVVYDNKVQISSDGLYKYLRAKLFQQPDTEVRQLQVTDDMLVTNGSVTGLKLPEPRRILSVDINSPLRRQ